MDKFTVYLLVPLISILLISAQAFWNSAVRAGKPFNRPAGQILGYFVTNPKVWAGAALYVIATGLYFVLLSKYKFFSVQVGMTALAIVFSTSLSVILFHEKLTILNIIGMILVLSGVGLVFSK